MIEKGVNEVFLAGTVATPFQFHHSAWNRNFYLVYVSTERASGTLDTVPVLVTDDLIDIAKDFTGCNVEVRGDFRSQTEEKDGRKRLFLSVLAKEFTILEKDKALLLTENRIWIEGYIGRKPTCRKTPLGRTISDTMISVENGFGKKNYIPTISWGHNARYTSNLPLGTKVTVKGRIQSRQFQKRLENDVFEIRTAYEVSVSEIWEVEEC